MLQPAADYGGIPVDPDEFIWIAFEGDTVFAAGSTLLWDNGEAEIRLCGGHRHKEWVHLALAEVERWARQHATKLTMRGRKGWARYLAGWAVLGKDHDGLTIFEKVL